MNAPTCGHTQLLACDFANQPRPLEGACLFCERDALLVELKWFVDWLESPVGSCAGRMAKARALIERCES